MLTVQHLKGERLVMTAVVMLAAVASYVLIGQFEAGGRTSTSSLVSRFAQSIPPVGTDPFMANGNSVSTSQVSGLAGYSVPFPSSPIANSTNVSKVWFAPGKTESGAPNNEVIIDYVASNTRIEIAPAFGLLATDPETEFSKMADSLGMPAGSVQSVHGVPALEQAPSNGEVGYVEIVLHGLRISVTGTASLADLITTTNTIS